MRNELQKSELLIQQTNEQYQEWINQLNEDFHIQKQMYKGQLIENSHSFEKLMHDSLRNVIFENFYFGPFKFKTIMLSREQNWKRKNIHWGELFVSFVILIAETNLNLHKKNYNFL